MTHTTLHNTVTVDGLDQMKPSGRFGWASLAQGRLEFLGPGKWQGTHDGYRSRGVTHRRTVERMDEDGWVVTDDLIGKGVHSVRLHWLIPDYPWETVALKPDSTMEAVLVEKFPGWKQKTIGGWKFRTPAGDYSLHIFSDLKTQWNIYRAGELVSGKPEEQETIPAEIRGWRSLRYARKLPALSIAGVIAAKLPVRFVSVWVPSNADPA